MCDEPSMDPLESVHDWPAYAARNWNRLLENGPGPDWLSCGLWLLAICPFWCDGDGNGGRCTGTG